MVPQDKGLDQSTKVIGRWVLFSTILASAMAFIDGSALNVALPALQADLQATGTQLLWVVNGYLLMLASLIMIGGSLGDRLGLKKVFMAGIGLFMLGSLSSGLSPTVELLIWSRMLQGIGGALMIPGSLALITASFESDRRGRAIGTWASATTLVTIIGPILGGFLADLGFWRGVFLINLPLGITALIVLHSKVPYGLRRPDVRAVNYSGAIFGALGLAGLCYGFITMPRLGLHSPGVFLPLGLGAVAVVVSILIESRIKHPMIPLSLFESHTFGGANLLTLFLYGALSVGLFFFSLNLVQAQNYSQSLAGLAFLPFGLILATLSRSAGGLVDRYGPRPPLTLGPALAGLGFFLLGLVGLTNGPSEYWTTFLPGIIILGVGMAVTVAPLTTTVMNAVQPQYTGIASGINNAVSRIAGVLAIAVVGAIALLTFSGMLAANTADINLTSEARSAVQQEASKLGDASVPDVVQQQDVAPVQKAIRVSFVGTYQIVMYICAGLAWLAAIAAAVMIRGRLDTESQA
jgi:EmrB/QacA subfamily drug resistance transporter